jgi:hypothetical protein
VSLTPVAKNKKSSIRKIFIIFFGHLFATSINNTSETGGKISAGVIDTGGKFAAGVVDTSCDFAAGVVDASDKFATDVVDTGGAL